MNIAILIPSLRQGGAEKQATILATVLDKHHSVDLYLLYGDNSIAPQNQELLKLLELEKKLQAVQGKEKNENQLLKEEISGKLKERTCNFTGIVAITLLLLNNEKLLV